MDKPEILIENKTEKILWDFVIKTDHPIIARSCNKQKETNFSVDFTVTANHRIKIRQGKISKNIKTLLESFKSCDISK